MPLEENLPSPWVCFDFLYSGKRKQRPGELIRALRVYLQQQHLILPTSSHNSFLGNNAAQWAHSSWSLYVATGEGKQMSQSSGCYHNTQRQIDEASALLNLHVSSWERLAFRMHKPPRDSPSPTVIRVTTLSQSSSFMPGMCWKVCTRALMRGSWSSVDSPE